MTQATNPQEATVVKRAFQAIEKLQAQVAALEYSRHEPIAIIGMACRFPGRADNPETYWQLLCNGTDAIIPLPMGRRAMELAAPLTAETNVPMAGFLEEVAAFDPTFFGISPREAATMDPQQRLLLEVTWEALESAGLSPETLFNSETGIFLGLMQNDYREIVQKAQSGNGDVLDMSGGNGTVISVAAGRIAYTLGLIGPAVTIDTACSSSLVAIHQACQSLRDRDCQVALVGGVNLILTHQWVEWLALDGAPFAADHHCKTFDAAGDGYVRGEGCGLVVLKRLSDAQADGDTILALIRGSMINQDGRSSGLTAPSGPSQQRLIQRALQQAQLTPDQVSYIEAHGTGTKLGDPIEMGAINAVFAKRTTPLWVSSVKTNFGHLEGAAGIAGLMKLVLMMKHGQIPPHLNFRTLNPLIDWDESPVQIPLTLTPWQPATDQGAAKRIAGVSSFGISGTNAHVIVEEAPPHPLPPNAPPTPDRSWHLLTLSAKSEAALQALVQAYSRHLETTPVALANLSYTSHIGRTHFAYRLALPVDTPAGLQAMLTAVANGDESARSLRGYAPKQQAAPTLAFLFTGQGSQYLGMGRELYETNLTFRSTLERCDTILQECLGRSLLDLLYPPTPPEHNDLLTSHPCGQATNFALECALADLWRSWGIQPTAVLGHSLGDFAAAYTAGVLSLEDGLRLVVERGRLMEQAAGSMVSVLAAEEEVAPFLAGVADVAIGVINGPKSVVISGSHRSVALVVARVQDAGFKTRQLDIPVAAHSPMLDPVLDAFQAAVRKVTLAPPRLPVVSSMTGQLVTQELTNPGYWRNHLRNTVRFADGVQTLYQQGCTVFLEIGPKPTLLGMAQDILDSAAPGQPTQLHNPQSKLQNTLMLPSLRAGQSDWQQMLTTLGALYVHGMAIDWAGFDKDYPRRKVPLPTYPFQRQRYWVDGPKKRQYTALRPLIDKMTHLPLHKEMLFETEFSIERLPFLADHRVYDRVISPGACQLALVLSAAEVTFGTQHALHLTDVILPQALVLPTTEEAVGARTVQVVLTPAVRHGSGPCYDFNLISFTANHAQLVAAVEPATHATGFLTAPPDQKQATVALAALQQACTEPLDIATLYAAATASQIALGPTFQWLAAAWRRPTAGPGAALVKVTMPAAVGSLQGHLLHPGLLDACFQAVGLTTPPEASGETHLPFALATLQLHQPITGTAWWCSAVQTDQRKWDLQLLDEAGGLLLTITGFEVRAAPPAAVRGQDAWRDWLYQVAWQPRPYFGLRPDYLPAPAAIAAAYSAAEPELWTDADRDHHQRWLADLDALSLDYVLAAFAKVGLQLQSGATLRTQQMMQQMSVISLYRRLVERLLAIVAEAGILQPIADGWRVLKSPPPANPATRLAALEERYGATPELTLLARCGERLSEVWRGLQEPLDLLFPGGDMTTAQQIYTAAPGAQILNQRLQQAVQTILTRLPAERGLRIVEIGAGTGGATSGLLPLLRADRTDYCFTDIGPAFLHKAQEQFADYTFVRYQPLDIEQPPSTQGFAPHQADLVLAANVLHATKDLTETLTHVQQLLQPGGQLILIEGVNRSRWVDLTFGLTTGWWRFVDQRRDHPLLTAEAWRTLLAAQGFQEVAIIEQEGQALILAQMADVLVEPHPSEAAAVELAAAWLLFADTQGVGVALADQLRRHGEDVILIHAGQCYTQLDAGAFHLHPDSATDYQRLLQAIPTVKGIVHLWSLDTPPLQTEMCLVEAAQQNCGTVLHLVQALLQAQITLEGFWLVTCDAQPATPTDGVHGVAQAGLWGMGKVIALEHPELNCRRIDLDAAVPATLQAERLYVELTAVAPATGCEEQVALRQDGRHVARLTRYQPPAGLPVPTGPYQLTIDERGTLDKLQLCPVARQMPEPDEVEIQVQASGLNFRDVLNALGLYPGDPGLVGAECAGVVVTVGAAVTQFAVGDPVLALASGSFSQYVTTKANQVMHRPATLSAVEAATIPTVFLTAYYGLHQLAGMKAGDRVLIHAAAGGVGMAALQLAQLAGSEVYATASPGKWETLRNLGITHIYNSRTTAFCDQLLADTDGRGVDMILNSLTGPGFIEANLAVLAPNGYLIEMSKRDIWSQEQVAAVRPDVRYTFFDLGTVAFEEPVLLQTMFQALMTLFVASKLKPLPATVYPLYEAVAAFRTMQQAKHTGKIVLTPAARASLPLQTDATYLITGGLGGLGLAVAQWLADQGARHLLLLGRRPPTATAQSQLAALTTQGVTVTVAQVDVTDMAHLQAVVQGIDGRYPLQGVIHSVGVLEDGALVQQSWERFARVLAPKMQGAWHLHQLTKTMPLDFFVLFSSAAGLLGNKGQANHAAANAFLDAFVHYRRAQGLPALSINWGAWSEIGAAAELVSGQRHQMAAQGMGIITPAAGIQAFAYLLQQQATQVGVVPITWRTYLEQAAALSPFWAEFNTATVAQAVLALPSTISLRQQLDEADGEERPVLLLHHLRAAAAKVLGLRNPEQLDPRQGLMEMGLDSLMAIELRNVVSKSLSLPLPATLLFDYPTLGELTSYCLTHLFEETAGIDVTPVQILGPTQENLAERVTYITQISDDEAEALLLATLNNL